MEEKILKEFARIWERYYSVKNHKDSTLDQIERGKVILDQCEIELNLLTRLTLNSNKPNKI